MQLQTVSPLTGQKVAVAGLLMVQNVVFPKLSLLVAALRTFSCWVSPLSATERDPCVLPSLVLEGHRTQEGFTEGCKVLVGMDTTGTNVRAAPRPRVDNTLEVRVIDIKHNDLLQQLPNDPSGMLFLFPFLFLPVRKT